MNILIVTGIFPPDIGGPASFVPAIANDLYQRGHNTTVITLSDKVKHDDSKWSFPVVRIQRSGMKSWRVLKTILKIMRLGRKIDLVFVHGLALESVIANFFLRKPLVQKIVGDLAWEKTRTQAVTDDSIDEFQEKQYGFCVELLKTLRSFWTRKADLIITPSFYLKGITKSWGVDEKKIRVIYNALNIDKNIHGMEPELFRNMDQQSRKIVSVGRLVPWKGFDALIRAVSSMDKNIQLVIIGDGPEKENLEALINEEDLQDRVHLAGSMPREKVFSFLKHADLFVLNSSYEGLPHIVFEAMAAGVPAMATNVGGTGELIQDSYNGILIPLLAPENLAQRMESALGDPTLKSRIVKNGFETIKDLSWKTLVEKTEEVLENAAKKDKELDVNGPLPVLFISTERYTDPPGPTLEKKWRGLKPYLKSTVISFSASPGKFNADLEGSRWILLPPNLPRLLRYVTHFSTSFFVCFCGALSKKYAAVIAQSPYEALAPAFALLPWRIFGSASAPKLIIEIHSDWQEGVMLYHRWRLDWLEKKIRLILGRFTLSQAHAYRAISRYCSLMLPQNEKPVFIFPTFTDLENFRDPSGELVQEISDKHGNGFFIFAGMLIYLKGVHLLINAFSRVVKVYPEAKLFIAGKGREEKNLQELAEQLKLNNNIFFLGHISQEELGAFIKNSSALILPSLTEGLGRVAIEAHLLGRPVIASRVGGIPEVVVHEKTGFLCDPGDEQCLSEAIIRLLDNPDLSCSMGLSGRQSIMNKFDYSSYFASYSEMVKNTCTR